MSDAGAPGDALTPARLDELERLEKKATPEPWEVNDMFGDNDRLKVELRNSARALLAAARERIEGWKAAAIAEAQLLSATGRENGLRTQLATLTADKAALEAKVAEQDATIWEMAVKSGHLGVEVAALTAERDGLATSLAKVRALHGEHWYNGALVDGCATGDCPHETSEDCRAHGSKAYALLCKELDEALAPLPRERGADETCPHNTLAQVDDQWKCTICCQVATFGAADRPGGADQ